MKPITVFMPVYNSEKYLKKSIESILNQSFKDFELLIINDGSTDNSLTIIKGFDDKRIRLVNNDKNMGLPYTRSKGLRLAKGKYIAIMDSDDIAYENRLKEQYDYLERNKDISFVASFVDFIKEDTIIKDKKNLIRKIFNKRDVIKISSMFNNIICNPTTMIRMSFINSNNIDYRSEYFVAQDYAFLVDCLKYGQGYVIPKSLIAYRTGHENITKKSLTNKKNFIKRKALIDGIKIRAIKNIGFKLDDSQLNILNKVFSDPEIEVSYNDLKEVNNIINIMIEYNIRNNIFDKKTFINICRFKFQNRVIRSNISLKDKFMLINSNMKNISIKSTIISNSRMIYNLVF